MENNENIDICTKCGGFCCKHYACFFIPEDLKEITRENIAAMIESGTTTIDWWEGDPREAEAINGDELDRCYFLRPLHKDEKCGQYLFLGSFGGECKLLGENGCMLDFSKRPGMGRALIPDITGNRQCDFKAPYNYTKQNVSIMWYPWQELLQDTLSEYQSKFDKHGEVFQLAIKMKKFYNGDRSSLTCATKEEVERLKMCLK